MMEMNSSKPTETNEFTRQLEQKFGCSKELLDEILGTLSEKEKKILRQRYGLKDGQRSEVTRERVRQIEAKVRRKLENLQGQ